MKNMILIGFMGAGKTTVGRILAREKEMAFVDTDERIADMEGRRIPDIFAEEGEGYFRDLETKLLGRMQEDTFDSVISVGGGMPVREQNRKLLRSLGCVIYLSAAKETILERVRDDGSRPMLEGGDLEAKVERLMRGREAIYRQTAHVNVRTDGRSVRQVLQIIEQETRRFG
ncbi:MAG: shikimate kinase [Lachnospiraceae bacterium]|jgi:shikimate kinase|nr:shikimate kinase [Lachnospiraceae bacterium]